MRRDDHRAPDRTQVWAVWRAGSCCLFCALDVQWGRASVLDERRMSNMLKQERRFYDERLEQWLARFPGRFVLVKGAKLIGTFDTVEEALAEGGRQFGLASFLVRRVERDRSEGKVPAVT